MVRKKQTRGRAKMIYVTDTGETYLIRMTPECIKVRKHYARKVLDVSFRDLVDLANGVDSVPVLIRLPRQTKVTA